jgi:hypothetical protein
VGEIRPLERGDLEQVTSLYEYVARSGSRTPPPRLAGYFEETFFDHPWADAEIPSLVYAEDDGRITGFLGSSVRRFVFDGRPVRLGVSGQLVADPGARGHAPGAFLMNAYMNGAQDLTITDTASELVRRIWEGVGGETFHLACVGWVRIFRPLQFASGYRGRRERLGASGVTRPVLAGVDAAAGTVLGGVLRPPQSTGVEGRTLSAKDLVDNIEVVTENTRLRPAYDEGFLEWLFGQLAAVTGRGELRRRIVSSGGRVRGWYVYYLLPGGISQVLQVAGDERDVGDVLDDLFRDAYAGGTAGLQGRVEAHLLEPLSNRRALLHPSGYLALVHARDLDLLYAVQSGRALLTRLEGEWWMGHHLVQLD